MKISTAVKRHLAAAVAIGLAATTAEAVVVIDAFTTSQDQLSLDGSVVTSIESQKNTAGLDILGGQRDLSLQTVVASGEESNVDVAIQRAGTLTLDQDADARAIVTLTYDGIDNPNTASTGLTSLDLTQGGDQFFRLNIRVAEQGATFKFSITTAGGGTSTSSVTLANSVVSAQPLSLLVPYASFTGGASFTNVDAIALEISGNPNLDVQITAFETAVPEPTSALAALGVLTAITTTMRRRTRQAVAV